jgi:integrase
MDGYPFVTEAPDRHGTTRYRFRRGKRSLYLPKQPGHPEFEEAYQAAIEGREPRKATVIQHPGRIISESFADAWRLVQKSAEWKAFDEATKLKNERLTNAFLKTPVAPGLPDLWRDIPMAHLRRRHLRAILADNSDTPHKAKHLLTAIRRLIGEALDQDWMEFDPSAKMNWRPEYGGWKAWAFADRMKYEKRWPNGTMPRAAYALALWAGNRRGDVATQQWSDVDLERDRITVRQAKTDKVLTLLLLPQLRAALEPLPRTADTVITTAYGKSFSEKSLTGMMAHWTKLAKIDSGRTLHGLRKTLGKYLAEEGATAKQSAGILGHDDLDHVELYSREAEQERLAVDGMSRLLKKV